MELEKLSKEIDIERLLEEISDLMSLKTREKDMISKYQRGYILEKAIEKIKDGKHNKLVLDEALAFARHELFIINLELYEYKAIAEKYSNFWKPNIFSEFIENFNDGDEQIKIQIDRLQSELQAEIFRKEIEIKNAKNTVKKYKEERKRGQQ